jgi:hypothetical protein
MHLAITPLPKPTMNNMPSIEACFQEFQSKLKETNKGFKGEVMKVLQAMNKQMFCLIKNEDVNIPPSHESNMHLS